MRIEFEDAGVTVSHEKIIRRTTLTVWNSQNRTTTALQLSIEQITSLRQLLDVLISTLIELKQVQ